MAKEFSRVVAVDSPECAQALAIYEAAFPPNERQSTPLIRQRIGSGQNQLFVGRQREVVFMALLWPLRGTAFTLLDYLATAPAARGQGWASAFLSVREELLLLEVEDPDFGSNRLERARRLAFYRKNGLLELEGVRYFLPPLQGGEPTEMRLMISPNYGAITMDAAFVRLIVTRVYQDLYGRPADDPLLQSFLPRIEGDIYLR